MFVRDCWVNGIRRLIISQRGEEEEFFEIRTEWSDRNILYLHRSYSDLGRLFKRLVESFPEDRRDLSKSPLIEGWSEGTVVKLHVVLITGSDRAFKVVGLKVEPPYGTTRDPYQKGEQWICTIILSISNSMTECVTIFGLNMQTLPVIKHIKAKRLRTLRQNLIKGGPSSNLCQFRGAWCEKSIRNIKIMRVKFWDRDAATDNNEGAIWKGTPPLFLNLWIVRKWVKRSNPKLERKLQKSNCSFYPTNSLKPPKTLNL